jgi:hypothetical protein
MTPLVKLALQVPPGWTFPFILLFVSCPFSSCTNLIGGKAIVSHVKVGGVLGMPNVWQATRLEK